MLHNLCTQQQDQILLRHALSDHMPASSSGWPSYQLDEASIFCSSQYCARDNQLEGVCVGGVRCLYKTWTELVGRPGKHIFKMVLYLCLSETAFIALGGEDFLLFLEEILQTSLHPQGPSS